LVERLEQKKTPFGKVLDILSRKFYFFFANQLQAYLLPEQSTMTIYLVVIDSSSSSRGALEAAGNKASDGDKIVVLSMYSPPSATAIALPTFESSFMRHQKNVAVEETRKHVARKLLYKAKEVLNPKLRGKKVEVEYVSRKTGNKKKGVTKIQGIHKVDHTFIPSPSDTIELFTDEEMIAAAKYLHLGKLSKEFSGASNVTVV